MTKTPEGFLICHDVPIARTGTQEYMPRELSLTGDTMVTVFRDEGEVFKPATLASFEGKPVTDNHPPTDVDPTNYGSYLRGVVQNVRRGSGDQSDYILADLVIHDASLIAEIEGGKREISCGYDCKYADNGDGTYSQIDIVGNHVAVVYRGRAGPAVSIQDEQPKGVTRMSKPKQSILQRMFASFVKDAEPDEIQEAAQAVNDAENATEPAPEEKEETKDEGVTLESLATAVAALTEKVNALAEAKKEPEPDALDELEKELSTNAETTDEDTSSETIEPEDTTNDEDPEDDGNEEKTATADAAVTLAAIRAIKPVIAAMPKEQRQKAADSLSKAMRDAMKAKAQDAKVEPKTNYAAMTKRKAQDVKTQDQAALRVQFGENCRKRNPHYKGGN